MLTGQQITSLAREYAEFTDISEVNKKYISAICKNFLKYTLRRYCLVDKDAVCKEYQREIEQGKHAHLKCQVESRAQLRLLESLFPEIAKEVGNG